jgi:hypothetical protein
MPPRKGIFMARSTRSRPLCLLLALALLAAPVLAATGQRSAPPSLSKTAISPSWASSLWSALVAIVGHLGGQMDPNGAMGAKAPTPPAASTVEPPATADSGGQMDPDG